MSQRLRKICEFGVGTCILLGVYVEMIPVWIGIPLGILGCLLASGYWAFQVHDRNQSDSTTSLDLR